MVTLRMIDLRKRGQWSLIRVAQGRIWPLAVCGIHAQLNTGRQAIEKKALVALFPFTFLTSVIGPYSLIRQHKAEFGG